MKPLQPKGAPFSGPQRRLGYDFGSGWCQLVYFYGGADERFSPDITCSRSIANRLMFDGLDQEHVLDRICDR